MEDAKGDVKQSTYEAYTFTINAHIYPHFKKLGKAISDMEYADVKGYYVSKGRRLSVNTLKKHHAIIKQALRHAVQNRLIANNPATEIRFPKSEKFKGKFLSIGQGNALLEAVEGLPLEPPIVLAMMYGLRRSEIAGLKWSAIDFKANTLAIRHTVTRVKTEIARDGTKNNTSARVLPLNDSIRAYLRKLRVTQAKEKLLLGAAYQNTEYVCRWPDGSPLKCGYISGGFKRLLTKRTLPPVRFHDLRHTCASFMLKAGCSMKDISDWLGHSNIQTSMDIYVHLDLSAKQEAADRVGNMLALKV